MAGHERGGETIAAKKKKKGPFHFIIMRQMGRMYNLYISVRALVLVCLFILFFVSVSVYSINRFIVLSFENKDLRKKLAAAVESLEDYQFQAQTLSQYQELARELKKAEQKLADQLAPAASGGEEPDEAASGPAEPDEPPPDDTEGPGMLAAADEDQLTPGLPADEGDSEQPAPDEEEAAPEPEPDPEPKMLGAEPPADPPVDAVQLTLLPDARNKQAAFSFNLKNIRDDNKGVAGYLFVVLHNVKSDPIKMATYPEVKLKNGDPADYKRGIQFNIRYGKTVRGQVKEVEAPDDFSEAWVFVYSPKGELLMKKRLEPQNE